MANLKPVQDAIKLIMDVILGSIGASEGGSAASILSDFSNVMGDLMVLLPEISQFPSPSSLAPADYEVLVASVAADLVLPAGDAKAKAIVDASLKLLSDLVGSIVPDFLAIMSASKQ
jgi:hypothetical protein